jgi:hypothetical protein
MPRRRALLAVAAAAALTSLAPVCEDGNDVDRIEVTKLPLAPGLEIVSRSEDCSQGTPGEVDGSCAHLLAIVGPEGLDEDALLAREIEALATDWTSQGPGVSSSFDSDDCAATVALNTGSRELRLIGPPKDVFGETLPPAVEKLRAALVDAMKTRAAISARLEPERDDSCVAEGGGAADQLGG